MSCLVALAGDDVVVDSGMAAGKMILQILGGLDDTLIIGSAGNDLVNGDDGLDTALLGAGNDEFVWNPGDDNDTIEGQAGIDTLLVFNGAAVAENIHHPRPMAGGCSSSSTSPPSPWTWTMSSASSFRLSAAPTTS